MYGKCSDQAFASMQESEHEHDGYAPDIDNVCDGDDIQFEVCLDCGQMQGEWPLEKTEFEEECEAADEAKAKRKAEYEAQTTGFDEDKFFN